MYYLNLIYSDRRKTGKRKKGVTKQQEKQLIELVKKGMDTKSVADIVMEQLDKDTRIYTRIYTQLK